MIAAGSPTPLVSQGSLRCIVAAGLATAASALGIKVGLDCPVILPISHDGWSLDRQIGEMSAARLDELVADAAAMP